MLKASFYGLIIFYGTSENWFSKKKLKSRQREINSVFVKCEEK